MGSSHGEFSFGVYLQRDLLLHDVRFAYGVQGGWVSPIVGTSLISFRSRLIAYIV